MLQLHIGENQTSNEEVMGTTKQLKKPEQKRNSSGQVTAPRGIKGYEGKPPGFKVVRTKAVDIKVPHSLRP